MVFKRLTAPERRQQIANIAATLFARRGFDGVTTREIARRARVSEAILFRHFPTKEALYTEIIDQKIRMRPEDVDLAAAEAEEDAEVFRGVARMMIEEVEQDDTFLRLMLYSALEDHRLASVFLKSRTSLLFDHLSAYIARRMRDGAFKAMKPQIAVRAFVGMVFHFIMLQVLFRVPKRFAVSKREAIDRFVEIFLDGMRRKR
jgi:TetR/AcrR family transcriptional regulator